MQFEIDNKLFLNDNKNINIPTVLQQCSSIDIAIPRFCYHEALTISGNCRMCLVEKENVFKPVASCAINLSDKLKIFTKTNLVKKARENVLEFLLINHPLDCPICDQGGECDLQDQSILYGNDRSRYNEQQKRSVVNKDCDVFIKTIMTRCIHCTRCVRFLNEIGGSSFFGVISRGSKMEISTYILNTIKVFNEFSGNIIDICPVGALTSKPYSFNSRSWELSKFSGININEPTGHYFSINYKNNKIYRILPYLTNDFLTTEWISDNIRFFYDGLYIQRLKKTFFVYKQKSFFLSLKKMLTIFSFYFIFNKIKVNNTFFSFFLTNTIDFLILRNLKKISLQLINFKLNSNLNEKMKNHFFSTVFRENIYNQNLKKKINFKTTDSYFFLFYLNPRTEFYNLNLFFRRKFINANDKNSNIFLFSLNSNILLNFEYKNLTNNFKLYYTFFKFKEKLSLFIIRIKYSFVFFIGQNFFKFYKTTNIMFNYIKKTLDFFNIDFFFIFKDIFLYNLCELNLFEKKNNQIFSLNKNNLNFFFNVSFFNKLTRLKSKFSTAIEKKNTLNFNVFFFSIAVENLDFNLVNLLIPIKLHIEKSSVFINFLGEIKKIKQNLKNFNDFNLKKNLQNFFFFIKNSNNLNFLNINYYKLAIFKFFELKQLNKFEIFFFKYFYCQNVTFESYIYFFKNNIIEQNSYNLKTQLNIFRKVFAKNFVMLKLNIQ